jgi:hypothetical protein
MATVAHHLYPSGPSQQEKVAESTITALTYLDM